MIVSFAGDSSYNGLKIKKTLKVLKGSTYLNISGISSTGSTKVVSRDTPVVITLKNKINDKVLSGKTLKYTLNGKSYTKVTNSKGQVTLLTAGTKDINVSVKFAGDKTFNSSKYNNYIKTVKSGVNIVCPSSVNYGNPLVITLKNNVSGAVLKNKKVVVTILNNGKSYNKTTSSDGKISIPLNYIGDYNVNIKFAGDSCYNSSSKEVVVKGLKGVTKLNNLVNVLQKGDYYTVCLKDSSGRALSNKKVSFIIANKTYNKTTDSKGNAKLAIDLDLGSYQITVKFAGDTYYSSSSLSKKLTVSNTISLSKIIAAASTLINEADITNELNKYYTVKIDNKIYSLDEFSYLMAQALTKINAKSNEGVEFKNLSMGYNSSGSKIDGKLYKSQYLGLAKNLTKFVNSNNRIANYLNANLGKVEADLYTWSFAKVLAYYGKNKALPSYVTVKSSYIHGGYVNLKQYSKILNWKEAFDKEEFAKYLKTGGASALNEAIINKAKSLTAGYTSVKAKANAIFNYVRDEVSYSFYSNSLKGAKKTLSTKSGNCCDKANLIVAMCRSVGIYARYSHAQGCKFSSGLNAGHVWAQVYDTATGTWYSADATSFRNSLGVINNWNTNSYWKAKNYALIPF